MKKLRSGGVNRDRNCPVQRLRYSVVSAALPSEADATFYRPEGESWPQAVIGVGCPDKRIGGLQNVILVVAGSGEPRAGQPDRDGSVQAYAGFGIEQVTGGRLEREADGIVWRQWKVGIDLGDQPC